MQRNDHWNNLLCFIWCSSKSMALSSDYKLDLPWKYFISTNTNQIRTGDGEKQTSLVLNNTHMIIWAATKDNFLYRLFTLLCSYDAYINKLYTSLFLCKNKVKYIIWNDYFFNFLFSNLSKFILVFFLKNGKSHVFRGSAPLHIIWTFCCFQQ